MRKNRIISNQLLSQKIHDFLKIALCLLHTEVIASIPSSDSLLDAIKRIVNRLHEQEHLLGFRNTVSIRQSITLLALFLLQYVIAFCHKNWSNLHHSYRVTTFSFWVPLTLYLNYRLHHWIPIKFTRGYIVD